MRRWKHGISSSLHRGLVPGSDRLFRQGTHRHRGYSSEDCMGERVVRLGTSESERTEGWTDLDSLLLVALLLLLPAAARRRLGLLKAGDIVSGRCRVKRTTRLTFLGFSSSSSELASTEGSFFFLDFFLRVAFFLVGLDFSGSEPEESSAACF